MLCLFYCQAQVLSLKSKVQRKGTVKGADTLILWAATQAPNPPPFIFGFFRRMVMGGLGILDDDLRESQVNAPKERGNKL